MPALHVVEHPLDKSYTHEAAQLFLRTVQSYFGARNANAMMDRVRMAESYERPEAENAFCIRVRWGTEFVLKVYVRHPSLDVTVVAPSRTGWEFKNCDIDSTGRGQLLRLLERELQRILEAGKSV